MNHNVTRNIAPLKRGVLLCYAAVMGCYVTVTPIVNHDYVLSDSVTPKRLNVTLRVLRFFGQCVLGQGGQSVRFLENNAKCNARLALKDVKYTSESSELLVR